jgi:hypothetical protein
MTPHYCPVEKTNIAFDDECNWCGMKEEREYYISVHENKILWAFWALVSVIVIILVLFVTYLIGVLI